MIFSKRNFLLSAMLLFAFVMTSQAAAATVLYKYEGCSNGDSNKVLSSIKKICAPNHTCAQQTGGLTKEKIIAWNTKQCEIFAKPNSVGKFHSSLIKSNNTYCSVKPPVHYVVCIYSKIPNNKMNK